MVRRTKDPEVGDTFGRLKVIDSTPVIRNNSKYFKVVCDCSIEKLVTKSSLTSGSAKSCGCYRKEVTKAMSSTHGQSKSAEYTLWKTMIQRCTNPNSEKFKDYGGRGISVEWVDFKSFYSDMGKRPSSLMSIERVNTNGNYCKENCVWLEKSLQSSNTRNSVRFKVNGLDKTLKQLSIDYGISLTTLVGRIYKLGWSIEKALSKPTMTPAECAKSSADMRHGKGRLAGSKLYL